MLEVKFYDTVDDSLLKFAVIISQSNGKWVFCKHKERDTYEVPGGHREAGENILETAKRELQEETGAIKFEISFTDKPMKRAPRLRVHFAAGYFDAKTSDKTIQRVNNVRNAFNSPFRPFVLATTSVGQEGLDFHLYSRKVVHWNLPNNPIDLEQREGRINRYMCHAIRQNVAANEDEPDWNDKFDATREKYGANSSEMIPYWCLPEDYPYKYQIERIVPMYPFSQDKTKYDRLINVLALYRLTLGQPRQEEMISILQREDLSSEQMEELFFDLSPYSRKQKNKG